MKALPILLLATSTALFSQQTEPFHFAPSPQILGAQIAEGPTVTGSPYAAQAVTDMTQVLADGNRIEMHSTSMRYRDSQGRERREDLLSGAGGTSAVFIWDPASRTSYTLDQTTHTAQKIGPLPPPPPAHRGSLGIVYRPPAEQADILKARGLDYGAFVHAIVNGSPADKAGLRAGDIILTLDGQLVKDSDSLMPLTLASPVGKVVTLNLDRDGKRMDISVVLQDRGDVFKYMPSALGSSTRAIVYAPFVQVPSIDQSTAKTEDLERMTVEGILAEGKRSTVTIPAGQIGNKEPILVVSETWYSPDLQAMLVIKHSDPRTGDTVYRLTNISRAEPPASLFQVPSDYTVTQAPGPILIRDK